MISEENVLDLYHASNEEATDVILSEILPEVAQKIGEVAVSEVTAALIGSIIGAVCPRINNIRLGWKQSRLERNVKRAITELQNHSELVTQQIERLKEQGQEFLFHTKYCEMMLDTIYDEIQENKVSYGVNGYINLMCVDEPNEDMALMFFKTLSELNELDIRVLRLFSHKKEENYFDIKKDTKMTDIQYRFIKEKLERLGMLQSKNEELRDSNLDALILYVKELSKQSKAKNPKSVKEPKIKKLAFYDSYEITLLGNQFLKLLKPIGNK